MLERFALAFGYGMMALAVAAQGYMVWLVREQVAKAQASLDKITALVDHVIKLH
jgi:hypothetical protein